MVELMNDGLVFSFPEVHPDARLRISFQRTLRIPDDDVVHHLPPGLGEFPLRHVDDFAARVPAAWAQHGGVMLPMYQSEALWIYFSSNFVESRGQYPFAVKIGAGKIDAVTGQAWTNHLHQEPQDYVVVPSQPWLDGFAVEKGVIRQFVAMPLGNGYTAEEQLTGSAEHGGLQILVRPMRREAFERRFPPRPRRMAHESATMVACLSAATSPAMGLAPGGRMKQAIHEDEFAFDEWHTDHRSRCFVHLANSLVWEAITGAKPPLPPPTAKSYTEHGLPWFDYYAEGSKALDGAEALRRLRSVLEMSRQKGETALPENDSVAPERVVKIRPKAEGVGVREGIF
jgi:hypothetical protein